MTQSMKSIYFSSNNNVDKKEDMEMIAGNDMSSDRSSVTFDDMVDDMVDETSQSETEIVFLAGK